MERKEGDKLNSLQEGRARQGRAKQGRARQGKAMQGRGRQGKAGRCTRKKEVKGRKKEVYREQHRAQPSVSAVLQATVLKLIIMLQYCSLMTFYHHTRILSAQ